ncbi:MAG: helix-turn-helix domain-containing protein [Chromatiales bacterium]|nr:helix-turn-helix transcriptional regulator [Gammaproteobacteria bacterium]MBW6477104.1 helix-turn-helix domain-containing protein [Chromatiales bacterium]
MNHLAKLKTRALQNTDVRQEYHVLQEEFELIDALLSMRRAAGLTQEELAQRMGTKKSNISRLEKGGSNPSWQTLQRYAKACGFHISMDFRADNTPRHELRS